MKIIFIFILTFISSMSLSQSYLDALNEKSLLKEINPIKKIDSIKSGFKIDTNWAVTEGEKKIMNLIKDVADSLKTQFKVLHDSLKKMNVSLNDLKEKNDKSLDVIAKFTSQIDNVLLTPNILLQGKYRPNVNKKGIAQEYSLSIFGAPSTSDTTKEFNTRSLFISENSLYAFSFNISMGFDSKRTIGFNINAYYASKSFNGIDSNNTRRDIKLGTLGGRAGLEYVLDKNNLSIFVNINYLSVATNYESFKEVTTNESKRDYWYPEVGIRGLLNLNGTSQTVSVEIKMIVNNKEMKSLIKREDSIIPLISIGYKGGILGLF